MLTLSRRINETIYLDETIAITLYDRLRFHALVAVLAPSETVVRLGDGTVAPVQLPTGEQFHLLTLRSHEAFRIDACTLRLRFGEGRFATGARHKQQLKVDIDAPQWMDICREEVLLRQSHRLGQRRAILRISPWMHGPSSATAHPLTA